MVDSSVITVRDLSLSYRTEEGEVTALDSVSLSIRAGEWLAILGPSGSGKTTLLRCIAGLERPQSGEIKIGERIVFSGSKGIFVPPEKRELSMVFQSYALWPHMTAFGNVAYPLESNRSARLSKEEIRKKVDAALDRVGCLHLAHRHPSQLSGGQQQRIAVARAIVSDVKAILFDEPLSSVDLRVREHLRTDLRILQSDLGLGAVYVTHDQSEAFVLGQRIAVMQDGRVAQTSTPIDLYKKPANAFVAEFVGSSNIVPGKVSQEGDSGTIKVETPIGLVAARLDRDDVVIGSEVDVAIRPEDISLSSSPPEDPGSVSWHAEVVSRSFIGMYTEHVLRAKDTMVVVRTHGADIPDQHGRVWATVPTGAATAFSSDQKILAQSALGR